MRKLEVREGDFTLKEKAELVYEGRITSFGNSAKIGAPKRYIGRRAYVVIVQD